MGTCLSGSVRVGAAETPLSQQSDVPAKTNLTSTPSRPASRFRSHTASRSTNRTEDMAVTESSAKVVDKQPRPIDIKEYSGSLAKNRKYFIFDRGDLIPRLNALNNRINSGQARSEGTDENCLHLNNFQLFTKPKRQRRHTTSINAEPALPKKDETSIISASNSLTPSSPSEIYSYQNGHVGNGIGGSAGTARSESRNTNTIASSPTSVERGLLKVPSLPTTQMDIPSNKRWDATSSNDNRSLSPVLHGPRRTRSNTFDFGKLNNNPELFRSIKESHSITRGTADTGYMRLNQYLLKHEIGRGSYGVVKLAYNEQDNKHYAMKALSKKRLFRRAALQARIPKYRKNPLDPMEKVHREIAILKKLNHPNVVKLAEVLDDPNEDNLYLVFELVAQGEVLSIPTDKPLSEENAWNYFRDTVQGLEYLHFQKIIHRDIKPANLLLDDQDRIKIADFGVSSQFTGADASLSSCTGTPVFLAPELLEPDPMLKASRQISGKAADMWALGITLYSFFYGTVPWLENSNAALHRKITSEALTFPEKPVISDSAKDLISHTLDRDPLQRFVLAQIKDHRWVTRNGECPMPPLVENCIQITVTDEEVANAVKHVPRIATLILVKYMVQKGSFRHPFHSTDSFRPASRSRSSISAVTPTRDLAPSADVYAYPPRDLYGQTPQNISFGESASSQALHQADNSESPKAVGPAIMMADAGLRRAFTRTNSVPSSLADSESGIEKNLTAAVAARKK